jgi:hypothetical protein
VYARRWAIATARLVFHDPPFQAAVGRVGTRGMASVVRGALDLVTSMAGMRAPVGWINDDNMLDFHNIKMNKFKAYVEHRLRISFVWLAVLDTY